MKKRTAALLMALVLLVGVGVGGTFAWLTAQTGTVTNTFTVGDIGTLGLDEDDVSKDGDDRITQGTQNYDVAPGVDIAKDPQVDYTPDQANPVDVYVFVKLDAGKEWVTTDGKTYNILDGKISFTIDSNWTVLDNSKYPGVYYKEVPASTALENVPVIANSKIVVSGDITKTQLESLTAADMNLPFTAYAIQQDGFATVAAAWDAVKPAAT